MNTCFGMFPADEDYPPEYQGFPYLKDCLAYSRILIFERFLSIASNAQPSDWLEFQRLLDLFSSLFWFLVLHMPTMAADNTHLFDFGLGGWDGMLSNIGHQLSKKKNWNGKVFVVLDEAQHDFDANICTGISTEYSKSDSYKNFHVETDTNESSSMKSEDHVHHSTESESMTDAHQSYPMNEAVEEVFYTFHEYFRL